MTEGLVKIPKIPLKLRNRARDLQKKLGQDEFYKRLIEIDPLIKNKINPKDPQRSIRAYEVKKYSNVSLIDWFKKTDKKFEDEDFLKIYIEFSRDELMVANPSKKLLDSQFALALLGVWISTQTAKYLPLL